MRINDDTYTELLAIRDRLDRRHTELVNEIEDVSRKLESVSTTLALLDGDSMPLPHKLALRDGVSQNSSHSIDIESLRGMKQVQALKKIAEHEGGQIRTSMAKHVLVQAGLIKNPKNANNILFAVIQRSGIFERVEPGVYRLISNKPARPKIFTESDYEEADNQGR